MPNHPAVVFDLDGTLIDSLPSIHAAVNATMETFGAAPLSLGQVRDFIGHGAPHLIGQVCALRNIPDTRQALTIMMENYDRAHDLTKPYDHVIETLKSLRAAGYALGVCTNKPGAATETALANNGLAGIFSAIISGDSLPQRKPAKEPLLATIAALNSEGAIFVGDSEIDAETAQAAGVPFVLFQRGYLHVAEKDVEKIATFDDYRQLPQILAQSGAA